MLPSPRAATAMIIRLSVITTNNAQANSAGDGMGNTTLVGSGVRIGSGTTIGRDAFIGRDVVIGQHVTVGQGSQISHASLGNQVHIAAGVRIGDVGAPAMHHDRRKPYHPPPPMIPQS